MSVETLSVKLASNCEAHSGGEFVTCNYQNTKVMLQEPRLTSCTLRSARLPLLCTRIQISQRSGVSGETRYGTCRTATCAHLSVSRQLQ